MFNNSDHSDKLFNKIPIYKAKIVQEWLRNKFQSLFQPKTDPLIAQI